MVITFINMDIIIKKLGLDIKFALDCYHEITRDWSQNVVGTSTRYLVLGPQRVKLKWF